jgi:prephenate dehydratase
VDETLDTARVGYLGPAGTFTEQALRRLHPDLDRVWPAPSVEAALDAVRDGSLDRAVVPFENSIEGSVSATLDQLIHGEPLVITRETHIEVQFSLLAREGMTLDRVRRLSTHPVAAAQTRDWIAEHLPGAELIPESSTARAAALVGAEIYDAAISAPLAARLHGLVPLAEGIADTTGAVTRFVELAREGTPPPPPTGADTTTLVAFIKDNRPGALLELLEQFAVRDVDLTRLESRPTGRGIGQYCFTIEAVGHLLEPRMAEALTGLKRTCAQVRFLGSYPRADGIAQPVAQEAGPTAYREAEQWVARLQGRG